MSIWGATAKLRLLCEPRFGSLSVRLFAGGGLDVLRIDPTLTGAAPDYRAEPSDTRAFGVLDAGAALALIVAPRVALTLTLSATLDLAGTRLVVRATDGEHLLFEPWLVRPWAGLGLRLHLR